MLSDFTPSFFLFCLPNPSFFLRILDFSCVFIATLFSMFLYSLSGMSKDSTQNTKLKRTCITFKYETDMQYLLTFHSYSGIISTITTSLILRPWAYSKYSLEFYLWGIKISRFESVLNHTKMWYRRLLPSILRSIFLTTSHSSWMHLNHPWSTHSEFSLNLWIISNTYLLFLAYLYYNSKQRLI